jgi:hypothetical protein
MRASLVLAVLVSLVPMLVGCSQSACQNACEKRKSCAQNLTCSKVPAAEQAGCQNAVNTWAKDDCSAITTCDPTGKKAADELLSCTLNNFCTCPTVVPDGPVSDILCHRPPSISSCYPPPNQFSATLWYCSGCGDCEGSTKTAACSPINNDDCRFFATSCIPKDYWACDGKGGDQVNFLCGYCFFAEAGAARLAQCNKLSDMGTQPPAKDAAAQTH